MKQLTILFFLLIYSSTSTANNIQTPDNVEPKHVYGLATSKRLAERMNIEIAAHCKETEGCRFYIDLAI